MGSTEDITDTGYWDGYWEQCRLPREIVRPAHNSSLNGILDVFDRFLPAGKSGMSALEIGGAPGGYLAYMSRQLGYRVTCLDYSETGCAKTRENFVLLNIDGTVIRRDLWDDLSDIPLQDIVYSLGVVEHFSSLEPIVLRHIRLIRPGGILMLGIPNLRGIYHPFLKRLAPAMLATHNLDTMRWPAWDRFEEQAGLSRIFRGYVGGFEPAVLCRCETDTACNRFAVRRLKKIRKFFMNHMKAMRGFNGPFISSYMMGVYRTPS